MKGIFIQQIIFQPVKLRIKIVKIIVTWLVSIKILYKMARFPIVGNYAHLQRILAAKLAKLLVVEMCGINKLMQLVKFVIFIFYISYTRLNHLLTFWRSNEGFTNSLLLRVRIVYKIRVAHVSVLICVAVISGVRCDVKVKAGRRPRGASVQLLSQPPPPLSLITRCVQTAVDLHCWVSRCANKYTAILDTDKKIRPPWLWSRVYTVLLWVILYK